MVARLLSVWLFAALAAGCGSSGGENRAPTRASRNDSSKAIGAAKELLVPPPIFVESAAGRQTAARGAGCVLTVGQGRGEGVADCYLPRRVRAKALSVIRPGERIRVVIPETEVIRRRGCVGRHECGGWATVRPLGCPRREVAFFELTGGTTAWRANLRPGAYELHVSVDFQTSDALTGDTSGIAGLLVARDRTQQIVPARSALAVCAEGRRK